MRPGRFFYKIAAWWLLVSAAAHSVGHYLFYMDESRFSPERLDIARQMQALVADPVLDGSLWRMLQAFSLAFGLFLLFAGISSLVLLSVARRADFGGDESQIAPAPIWSRGALL